MPFTFNLISEADILRSRGGDVMMDAINYPGKKHLIVTGCPGSGKTTITIMRALKKFNEGKSIAVITYQNMLRIALKGTAVGGLRRNIYTFHKWYVRYTNGRYIEDRDTAEDLIAVLQDKSVNFDEILIDEGQDFEQRFIETAARTCSQLSIGSDSAQKIHQHGIDSSRIERLVEENFGEIERFNLLHNYRNNYETYFFAIHFVPDNLRAANTVALENIERGRENNLPVIFQAKTHSDTLEILSTRLRDAGEVNVAVLLYHTADVDRYFNEITEMGFRCSRYHSDMTDQEKDTTENNLQNILVTTYKSAKGMEFQVVIMPDMQEAKTAHFMTEEHYYVACTRARENLYLIFQGEIPAYLNTFEKNSYIYRPHLERDDLPF